MQFFFIYFTKSWMYLCCPRRLFNVKIKILAEIRLWNIREHLEVIEGSKNTKTQRRAEV